jgi:Na+/melibiose symporter-like transporter
MEGFPAIAGVLMMVLLCFYRLDRWLFRKIMGEFEERKKPFVAVTE